MEAKACLAEGGCELNQARAEAHLGRRRNRSVGQALAEPLEGSAEPTRSRAIEKARPACRRLVTTGTMDRFMGANWAAVETGGGKTCLDSTHGTHKHTRMYPASGLTEGDNTPTAALRCISMVTRTTMCFLSSRSL